MPLHTAAEVSPTDWTLIEFLVNRHPEALRAKDEWGSLPLHVALESRKLRLRVVQCMVDASPASLTEVDSGGNTPLHIAARNAEWEVVKFLVKRCPASLRVKNKAGNRPADICRVWRNDGSDELFAQWDADPDAIGALASGHSERDEDDSSAEEEEEDAEDSDNSPAAKDSDSHEGTGSGGRNQEPTQPPTQPPTATTSSSTSGRLRLRNDDAADSASLPDAPPSSEGTAFTLPDPAPSGGRVGGSPASLRVRVYGDALYMYARRIVCIKAFSVACWKFDRNVLTLREARAGAQHSIDELDRCTALQCAPNSSRRSYPS